jgi:hypothetical protein
MCVRSLLSSPRPERVARVTSSLLRSYSGEVDAVYEPADVSPKNDSYACLAGFEDRRHQSNEAKTEHASISDDDVFGTPGRC